MEDLALYAIGGGFVLLFGWLLTLQGRVAGLENQQPVTSRELMAMERRLYEHVDKRFDRLTEKVDGKADKGSSNGHP